MPTPRARRPLALLLVTVVATAAAAVAARTSGSTQPLVGGAQPSWDGLVGARPEVALPARSIVVLRTPSVAARFHAAGRASPAEERAWSAAATAAQDALLRRLAGEGIALHPELRFTRVLDGFSARLDPATAARLEQDTDVAGVYPVRVAYPATTAEQLLAGPLLDAASGHRPPAPPAGLDGAGVTIALLDTHVDARVAFLHGAVLPEIDVVGPTRGSSAFERHGTEMAGLVVGRGGPGGLSGVAPGARIRPIRVAARQRDTRGVWAVFARSDQIVAGLDRAVDPNADGDAHDAVPIALVPLAEPYAGFDDSPESLAVAGAVALGTFVVAPSGNDGPAAPRFGDLSGPGGASSALTVGAVDTRVSEARASVSLTIGSTRYRGTLPLSGLFAPERTLSLPVATSRGSGSTVAGYFTPSGASLVAGRAALVAPGTAPGAAVRRAATAGASAVLLGGRAPLPAGGLPLDDAAAVPVVSLPRTVAARVRSALAVHRSVRVTIASAAPAANPGLMLPAGFSSTGLSFAGLLKPGIVAPGVSLATADPGDSAGRARWVTVSGTSAAAAVAAGDAALLLEHDPRLDAAALRSLLVGSTHPLQAPLPSQGNGAIDAALALEGRLAATPPILVVRDGRASFTLRNLGDRPVDVTLGTSVSEGTAGLSVAFSPQTVRLGPRGAARVRAVFSVTQPPNRTTAAGTLVATPAGGGPQLRIPWAVRYPSRRLPLLGAVRLSRSEFSPADRSPAALSVDAGKLFGASARPDVRALSRLDVELWRGSTRLGVIARLRDVLPGRYTFGLTGRGPDGRVLQPGRYTVQVVAYPVDASNPTRRRLRFALR